MALSLDISAVNILKRAVELDEKRRYTEARICYEEGIQLLIDVMKITGDEKRRSHYRDKVEAYMKRAEAIKKKIEEEKNLGVYHEQITLADNSIGYSYEKLFGRFLNAQVTEVYVEDPYIRTFHQCQNFVRFCELAVKRCQNLKIMTLLTTEEPNSPEQQGRLLQQLQQELSSRQDVKLVVSFSPTLHDRTIKLSNGWIIKIGRGLDYFKAPESKFSLGYYDLDLRPCHETTVDVFHEKDVRTSQG